MPNVVSLALVERLLVAIVLLIAIRGRFVLGVQVVGCHWVRESPALIY